VTNVYRATRDLFLASLSPDDDHHSDEELAEGVRDLPC
jgi:hypothetical protein